MSETKSTDPPALEATRRRFLQGAAAVAAAGCASDVVVPGASAPAVATVGGADLDHQVQRAIELVGGLPEVAPSDVIFIKPNAVHPAALEPGIATSNDILGALVRHVRAHTSARIVVGDRSSRLFASGLVFDATGMRQAALEAGADEVYAAPTPADVPEDWVSMQPLAWQETWEAYGGVLVMRRLVEADVVINLPVAKNHRWAGFSLALKNFIGGIGDESRDPMHYKEGDPAGLSRDIAVLNGAFEVDLNLLDARRCLVNGGPEGVLEDAVFADAGLVMASADRVAMDALGASLLQHLLAQTEVPTPDPVYDLLTTTPAWALPQIVEAQSLGLGGVDGVDTALAFEDVAIEAELRTRFTAV